jgi:multidrug resistance efflux pump
MRKVLIVVVLLAAVGGGIAYFATSTRARGLVLTGIVATDDVIVSSQIAGQLTRLRAKEGDQVTRNELLAVIDPQQYQADRRYYGHTQQSMAAQVRQAEVSLRYQELQTRDQINQAKASLASAKAQQAQAAANLKNAEDNYHRTRALFNEGIVPAQSDVQAEATYEADRAALESAAKQVAAQKAALAMAESNEQQILLRRSQLVGNERQWAASVAQTDKAQVILDETRIRSPIDGVVDVRAALQGEVVNAGQAIVTLIDPDDLWVSVDVPETYIDRIRIGGHLNVKFPSGMEKTGTVFFRGVDADYATERDVSRTKRDIKTFEIRLRVDNSDRRIWPGLTAYVTLPWNMLQIRGSGIGSRDSGKPTP